MAKVLTARDHAGVNHVNHVYDAAEAYEIAFSYRDVAAEADAIERWYGGRPEAVLELAAGPADHAIETPLGLSGATPGSVGASTKDRPPFTPRKPLTDGDNQ